MKKILWAAVLCAALLCGCSEPAAPIPETEETLPAPTVPADGDPNTVACQGSYSGSCDMDMVVARVEDAALTNRKLQVWYRAEVEQYRQSGSEPSPDFGLALDVQPCDLDEEALTWQQYFLKRALSRCHTVQALICHSEDNPLPLEEAYKGDRELLDKYKPAYLIHGHVHTSYGHDIPREIDYNGSKIINACQRYVVEIPDKPYDLCHYGQVIYKTRQKREDLFDSMVTK